MRIAVLSAVVPFAAGPRRRLAAELVSALEELGHAVLAINVPLPAGPLSVEHILAIRAMRLPNVDRAIALGFPACAVTHPEKVVWLAADDNGCPYGRYLREAYAVYAGSASAALRLKEEIGVPAGVLTLPAAGVPWRRVVEALSS